MQSYPLDESRRCAACRAGEPGFDAAYAYGSYEGPLRALIHLFTYGKIESLAKPLARFLVSAIPLDERFDLVIPLPLHWRRGWQRGFNQAELLARPVAKRYGIRLEKPVRRVRATKTQASLSQAKRRANLKGAFQVTQPAAVAGKRILLIDDVFTTGATLRACAGALKEVGASRVVVLTLARVDRRGSPIFDIAESPSVLATTGSFTSKGQIRST